MNAAVQEGNGLYGAFIVDDPAEPTDLGDEVVMVLSDIDRKTTGRCSRPTGRRLGTLFGREGNVLLVNGKVRPTLKARPGLRQRWRFINAAKSRYFQIALDGHTFTRIGGDGGLLTAPVDVAQPVIDARRAHGPARRARRRRRAPSWSSNGSPSIVVTAARSTARPGSVRRAARRRPRRDAAAARPSRATIAPLPTEGATPIALSLTYQSMPFQLGINGVPFKDSEPLMATSARRRSGRSRTRSTSRTPSTCTASSSRCSRRRAAPLEWKDTVNVPVDGTVSFVVRYDDRPGMWMFHCHILDHAEAGMMGSLMVMEPE